ncbi:MAG: dihydroorotase [Hyphomicrobiales bacterium]|nr:dihydroorotase [Hyphomicrobiales bacterium]
MRQRRGWRSVPGEESMDTFDLVIRGGTVVNHAGVWAGDVGVRDGRIAGLGSIAPGAGAHEFDARGLHVLPGVIDTQVHFREPGAEHKEDLETGSRAAVAGGVTAVFEMPNTNPPTTSAAALADKVARARNRMFCDFAFFAGATADNVDDLPALERMEGCAGVKVFIGSSTGSLLVEDEATLARVLAVIRRRASFHSEDEARLRERARLRIAGDAASHPVWRDEIAAVQSTERLLRLARAAGSRVHALHISTAEELPLLAAAKDFASAEVTPHHLTLSADDYARLGTKLQMNPPVRDARHAQALWEAVASGVIDILGSDHAPHTLEEKAKPYPQSPSGMPGVQTLVPVMLDHVNAERLSIERFVDMTSAGPARLFGIAGKGRIAAGYDADFTVVDMNAEREITDAWIESRCGWTPYAGMRTRGWPVATIVRGHFAMREGKLAAEATGAPVRLFETLTAATGA